MCGIFGIINTQHRQFDKRAFFTLGINNDSRGGDACGVFIDGKVDYGTSDASKFFINFYDKSKLIEETNKCKIALGHCRKASVGGVSPEKAQPCVIYNENGKVDFVVTHNGTIKNYEDLAKKYIPDININGLTDSQVITLIFYHKGFDMLTEYIGTAAFVAVDYRPNTPKVYLFHGKSLATKYVEKTTEERPLYLISNKNTTVYSSIPDYLYGLFYQDQVMELKHNKLVSINHKGDLYVVAEYDRSKATQQEYSSSRSQIVTIYPREFDDYDDYYGYRGYSGSYRSSKEEGVGAVNQKREEKGSLHMDDNFIVFNNAVKAHGKFIVDSCGNILSNDDIKTTNNIKTVYIYSGIVVYNKDCFDILMKISDTWCCTPNELYSIMPCLIYSLSPYPMRSYNINKDYLAYIVTNSEEKPEVFDGNIQLLFSVREYRYDNGIKNYETKTVSIDNCFDLIDKGRDFEVPTQIIIDYLNDFV